MYNAYRPISPYISTLGAIEGKFKNLFKVCRWTPSTILQSCNPHNSAEYNEIDRIWASNNLKNRSGDTCPSFWQHFVTWIVPALALLVRSDSNVLMDSLVENTAPRYLYSFTTFILSDPRIHFSYSAKWPPLRNTLTFVFPLFTVRLSMSAPFLNTFIWFCQPTAVSDMSTMSSANIKRQRVAQLGISWLPCLPLSITILCDVVDHERKKHWTHFTPLFETARTFEGGSVATIAAHAAQYWELNCMTHFEHPASYSIRFQDFPQDLPVHGIKSFLKVHKSCIEFSSPRLM